MNHEDIAKIKSQIKKFVNITNDLKREGLFRSDKYWGDIGEKICESLFELTLCDNERTKGYDATKDNKKYQIKLHRSLKKTNITLGNPEHYDYLYLLVWEKYLNPNSSKDGFHIYHFTKDEVKSLVVGKKSYDIGKKTLQTYASADFFEISIKD